jgi:acetylornithine deacetylase/succinyl-diaminopimelate desuccinylase-like protein
MDPVLLLQQLIRFDTTNPPGREAACVLHIRDLLAAASIDSTLVAKDPERPNLVARLKGRGQSPPLLLYGHVDVVTAAGQPWSRPPFSGELADGYVWGRGALDMKGGVAMLVTAFLRAQVEGLALPGDVILAILSDEEAGSDCGARFLVQEHPELVRGARYALGEFGGFSLPMAGKRFYPIQVAEKQMCHVRLTFRGEGGHGSLPVRGAAMARLARALTMLDRQRLPVRVTPAVRQMIGAMADALGGVQSLVLRGLLKPALTDLLLDRLGSTLSVFDPLLHNTVSPTIFRGSDKINVIPSTIELELDARLVPGCSPADLQAELAVLLGPEVGFEVVRFMAGPPAPDMGLFDRLAAILKEADPEGIPVPIVLPGVTDAPWFAALGIQSYGFLPMRLPPELNFMRLIHGADERVPAEAVRFGAEAIYKALQRF